MKTGVVFGIMIVIRMKYLVCHLRDFNSDLYALRKCDMSSSECSFSIFLGASTIYFISVAIFINSVCNGRIYN